MRSGKHGGGKGGKDGHRDGHAAAAEAERQQAEALQRRAEQIYDGVSGVLGVLGAVALFSLTFAFTWRVQW